MSRPHGARLPMALVEAPKLMVDRGGAVVRVEDAARDLLKAFPGSYRVHRADALLVLVLDEGTGTGPLPGEALSLAGDIATMPLLGLMNLLGQNRETGRLVVKSGDLERVILLKNGDVASVGSNQARDRLGAFLLRLGRVTERDLDAANIAAQKTGARIGQVLVQQKLLEPHELWGCIQEQITELFAEVTQWVQGSFVLFRIAAEHTFPSTPPLNIQGLLMESVRRADEMSVFRERVPSADTRLRRTQKAPKPDLGDDETRALQELGTGASVADMARRLAINEFDTTRLCYQLLKMGLVEVARELEPVAPVQVSEDNKQRVYLYNLAFREIRDEIHRHGQLHSFLDGVRKFLADRNGLYCDLFRGVPIDDNGALHEPTLVMNLAAQHGLGREPSALLTEALNELTFFMLFQCGETLDAKNDENLGRRVRLIHASLPAGAR